MKKIVTSVSVIGFLLVAVMFAYAAQTRLAPKDGRFMHNAAIGGMLEVQLGKLAEQKAESKDVKDFGARMAADHGKANAELEQIAKRKGVTLPAKLDPKHQKNVDRLSKLSGAKFDRVYMAEMVKDHRHDAAAFKWASRHVKDPDVKNFAAKTLPVVEDHLKMAKDIKRKIKK